MSTSHLASNPRCPECGSFLAPGTPVGMCPLCVVDETEVEKRRLLGDCELIEEIGRGGMGVVWRGWQRGLNREVAVKTLPGGDLASAEARARFHGEAQAMARLKHPGIVAVYGVGECDGVPYFIMELVRGRTLGEVLAGEPLPWRQAARWVRDAALAVQHAHEQGVLHRDLKPSNILIEIDETGGRPRVSDFGIAKLIDAERSLTQASAVLGSPAYLPPEVVRRGEFTARGDVYGLGAILYCALTGRPLFHGESPALIVAQVERDEPVPPRRLRSSIPLDLETICLKCLEKKPTDRYATAREVAEDLGRLLEGHSVLARPVGTAGRFFRAAGRHPWRAAAGVLASLVVVGIGLVMLWKIRSEQRHLEALGVEQAATRVALIRAQLGEARGIVHQREADSRSRAERVLNEALALKPDPLFRDELRTTAIAAMALPSATTQSLVGEGIEFGDWTLATGDLPRERWALATMKGSVQLRALGSAASLGGFNTAPRFVSALIAFSPGGRWLAIRHRDELGIWDTAAESRGRLVLVTKNWDEVNRFGFMKVAFAPDDSAVLWQDGASMVATALPTGVELRRWRAANGERLMAEALAFEPGGKWLAVGRGEEPAVELRRWPDGQVVRTFRGRFPRVVQALAMASDAQRLAGGDDQGRVTVWRGDGGEEPLLEFRGHTGAIRALTFTANGRHLISTSDDGTTRYWDCVSGSEVVRLPFDCGVASVSMDGTRWGIGYTTGKMGMAQVEFSPVHHIVRPAAPPVNGQWLSFYPDGRSLVCLSDSAVFQCAVPGGEIIAQSPLAGPYSVLVESGPKGEWIAAGRSGLRRTVGQSFAGEASLLPSVRYGWGGLAESASGRAWAAVDFDRERIGIWPAAGGNLARARFIDLRFKAVGLALAPEANAVAVTYRSIPGLSIINTATGEPQRQVQAPPGYYVAWSPDGRWIVGNGPGTICWETTNWETVALPPMEPNTGLAGAVAFSPAGTNGGSYWLAVASGSSKISVLKFPERKLVAVLEAPSHLPVYLLRFSPDSRWLGAAVASGEVQLWDLNEVNQRLGLFGLGWN